MEAQLPYAYDKFAVGNGVCEDIIHDTNTVIETLHHYKMIDHSWFSPNDYGHAAP